MHPVLFSFDTPSFIQGFLPDQIKVYSYGFMIALGILASFYLVLYKTRSMGLNSDKLSNLFLWIILAAFVGGKFFYYLEDPGTYTSDPSRMLDIKGGGFVFYGSLLFAIPTMVFWLRKNKIAVRPFFDVVAFAGPVVHSFGRVGCFLAGCCHGEGLR